MAITQAMCSSFKQELLQGLHNFTNGSGGGTTTTTGTGNTYYCALYTNAATLGATSTVYVTANETTNTAGSAYNAGGQGLVYWEPAWVSTDCFTLWAQGSHWDNATLFDNNNQATLGMKFYNASLND